MTFCGLSHPPISRCLEYGIFQYNPNLNTFRLISSQHFDVGEGVEASWLLHRLCLSSYSSQGVMRNHFSLRKLAIEKACSEDKGTMVEQVPL